MSPVDTASRLVSRWSATFSGRLHYIKAGSIYSIERIASSAANFVVYLFMGRLLGPVAMGAFNYAQTAANLAGPFLAVGAEPIVVRELVREPARTATILGSGWRILFINSLIVAGLPLLIVHWGLADSRQALSITGWLVLPFLVNGFLVIDHYFRAHLLARQLVTARVSSVLLGLTLKLAALFAGLAVTYVAAGFAVEQVALVLLLLLAYRHCGQRIRDWSSTPSERRLLLRQSLPAMISAVVVQLFFRVNFLMLGWLYAGPDGKLNEVGQYGLAFQVVQLTGMFPVVVFGAIYPRLVRLRAEQPDRYRQWLRWLLVFMTAAGYLLVLLAYWAGPPILHGFFAGRFDRAAAILTILCVSTVFNFSGAVRAQFINIEGLTQYHLLNAALGLAVLVPVSYWLIPSRGGLGAAYAAAIATFISGVLSSLLLPGTRRFGIDQLRALLLLPAAATSRRTSG
jgi:PST family polysaccharide transporter